MLTWKAGELKSLGTALATNNMDDCCIKELKTLLGVIASEKCVWSISFPSASQKEGKKEASTGLSLSLSIKTPITPSWRRSITRVWQQLMHLYIGYCVINGHANSWWQWESEFPQFTALCKTSSGTFLCTIITQTPPLTSLSVSEWYQRLKTHNHSSVPCVLSRAAQCRDKS